MSNEISLVTGESGINHNGIFRGKNLGTISSLNEYIAFRTAHGIDDHTYKDLYLGDYFKIQDGTYNTEWVVAHFDYYLNKGGYSNPKGVVLIAMHHCGDSKMQNTRTSEGGYAASMVHTKCTTSIATALSTVLGSYLQTFSVQLSKTVSNSTPSMAGMGWAGATTDVGWYSVQAVIPNEVQIYGTTVFSSSALDVTESNEKLALFNFINQVQYGRGDANSIYWLRSVTANDSFAYVHYNGTSSWGFADSTFKVRPLIYIG